MEGAKTRVELENTAKQLKKAVDCLIACCKEDRDKLSQFDDINCKFEQMSKEFVKEIDLEGFKTSLLNLAQEDKKEEVKEKIEELDDTLQEYSSADLFEVFSIDFENFKATFSAYKDQPIRPEYSRILETTTKIQEILSKAPEKQNLEYNSAESFSLTSEKPLKRTFDSKLEESFSFLSVQNIAAERDSLLLKLEEKEKEIEQLKDENKEDMQENSKEALEGLLDNYLEDFRLSNYSSADKLIEMVETQINEKSLEKLRFAFKCLSSVGSKVGLDLTEEKDKLDIKNYFDLFKDSVSRVENSLGKVKAEAESALETAAINSAAKIETILRENEAERKELEMKHEKEIEALISHKTAPIKKIKLNRRNTVELEDKLKRAQMECNLLRDTTKDKEMLVRRVKELELDNNKLIAQKLEIAQEFDSVRDLAHCFVENESKVIEKRVVSNMLVNYLLNRKSKKGKSILESFAGILELGNEDRLAIGLKPTGQYVYSEGSTMHNTSRLPSARNLFGFK